jgi:hypothetical protein
MVRELGVSTQALTAGCKAQTIQHAKESYSAHLDYLYASLKVAEPLSSCYAVGASDESVWSLSDQCPVVAEFEV